MITEVLTARAKPPCPVDLSTIPSTSSGQGTYLEEGFESWPQMTSFSNVTINSWSIHSARVLHEFFSFYKPHSGLQAAWLNTLVSSGTNTWIQTPYLVDGGGILAFWACLHNNGFNDFIVQSSPDATNWTTRAAFTVHLRPGPRPTGG